MERLVSKECRREAVLAMRPIDNGVLPITWLAGVHGFHVGGRMEGGSRGGLAAALAAANRLAGATGWPIWPPDRPRQALLQVSGLVNPTFRVEIEALAST
jgi:enamine deaminase RidA (YjgF/YER057c/UK114 family)